MIAGNLEDAAHRGGSRVGVLLVNLGTPAAPTAPAIRRYLRQFLSDPRVVELPRALWLPILHGFILPFRPRRLVHAYAKVWGADGSPLMAISLRQREALERLLGFPVALAMTYGEPSIDAALAELERRHVRKIVVLPMYPQYSGTTTAAVFDGLAAAMRPRRWLPEIRTVHTYHDDAGYVDALAKSLEAHWAAKGRADRLLISFHSIPRRYVLAGDPYLCFCHKTARLLVERLGLAEGAWSVAFQSRLGREPWLQPYTDVVVPALARDGVRTLDVVCPGFPADCLETLEEVAIRYAEDFRAAGGETLRYVPALNDDPIHIAALAALVRRHVDGWDDETPTDAGAQFRLQRAAEVRPTLGP